jgi:hypothetical protein
MPTAIYHCTGCDETWPSRRPPPTACNGGEIRIATPDEAAALDSRREDG